MWLKNGLIVRSDLRRGRRVPAKAKLHQTTLGNIQGHVITGSLVADIVHNARQAATWCNRVIGSRFPTVMSSTYFHLKGAAEATSLTMTRNTTGPTLVPCGTPQVMADHWDVVLPRQTHSCLLLKKSEIHGRSSGLTCIWRSFWMAMLVSTLSKAVL